jgi:hypothetical protein
MKCKICGCEALRSSQAEIINKYRIQYFFCKNCCFMQTEEPYWLPEAYSSAISNSDTGVLYRNNLMANIASVVLYWYHRKSGQFLDFGGGYGVFVRLMRDAGFDFYWYDKYAQNLFAIGFEGGIENTTYSAVTSFENFEHFYDPMKEIDVILSLTDFVLFTTELLPEKVPLPTEWWYYCLEHGQHISLYSKQTLELIAKQKRLYFVTNGRNLHVFSKSPISAKILRFADIARRIGVCSFFKHKSKTVEDMMTIIQRQRTVK